MSQPNIILCTCDQLRAFETGCYGNKVVRTPHVDRLAAEGVRFETAVTNFPVCMAARSVLLSGEHNRTCTGGVSNVTWPWRPGQGNMPEYPDPGRPHLKDTTLPEILRDRGYHTDVIGKWHIHSWPDDVGFKHYLIPRVHHCHSGQSYTEDGGPEFVPEEPSVDYEAGRVETFLREQAESHRPFFLYYNISPPHCPVADIPDQYLTMYDPDEVPIRPNVDLDTPLKDQDYWFKIYRYDFRYYFLRLPYTEHLPEGYSLRHLIAEYYGMTTWMDDAFGRMLAALDAAGLAENTIVVFTSDHGDNLGSLGLVQKGGPNEESARIPLIVRWPKKLEAGRVVTGHVPSLADVMPSLLDLVGAETPAHVQGRSFAPLMRGEDAEGIDHSIIETSQGVAIRTPSHMYYLEWDGPDHVLRDTPTYFFDLTADPYELDNLAGTDAQPDVARDLDTRIRAWHEKTPWMTEA